MTLESQDIEHTVLGHGDTLPTVDEISDAKCRFCSYHFVRLDVEEDWLEDVTPLSRTTVCNFPYGNLDTDELRAELLKLSQMDHIREIDVVVPDPHYVPVIADHVVGHTRLKIIVEPHRWDEKHRTKIYEDAVDNDVDYLKTFTGVTYTPTHGEHRDYVKEMAEYLPVKAAGNIRTVEEARDLHDAGAERIGSSSGLTIAKNI